MIAWIDLETTGLEPVAHSAVLEGCCILTDDELNELWRYSAVCRYSLPEARLDPPALMMHQDSGLLALCRSSLDSAHSFAHRVIHGLTQHGVVPGTLELAGSSVQFDRKWMIAKMPELEHFFHYRNFDISSLRAAFQRWAPNADEPQSRKLHRAAPDLEDTINLARFYMEQLQRIGEYRG